MIWSNIFNVTNWYPNKWNNPYNKKEGVYLLFLYILQDIFAYYLKISLVDTYLLLWYMSHIINSLQIKMTYFSHSTLKAIYLTLAMKR